MSHTPKSILEARSGRTSLCFVFTILVTGGIFLVLPLTQLSSKGNPPSGEPEGASIRITPPPKPIDPPEPEKKPKDPDENIKITEDFDKVTIRDMDHFFNNRHSSGIPKVITGFSPEDFTIENPFFDMEEVDKPPKALLQPAPPYPYALKQSRLKGLVEVEYIVTEKGEVTRIQIKRATHQEFGNAVSETLRRWSFEPGTLKEKAVATRVRQVFQFSLK